MKITPELRESGAAVLERRRTDPNRFAGTKPPGILGHWPQDEYLADGGDDRGSFRVRSDWSYTGLQREDTVAHFDTVDGKTLVEASNRVHLYAPRFGTVRKIEESLQSKHRVYIAGTEGQLVSSTGLANESLGFTEQETGVFRAKTRMQPSGTRGNSVSGGVRGDVMTRGYEGVDAPMYYANLLTTAKLGDARMPFLAQAAAAARAWAGVEQIHVRIANQAAMSTSVANGTAQLFTIEEGEIRSQLRLIKVASKKAALPGENVEFMLRFDNLGNRPLGNITILDNLTTRLELVPGSAQCSVPAAFVVEPNDGGSDILRFEITDPLLPGDYGVVKFECRVR